MFYLDARASENTAALKWLSCNVRNVLLIQNALLGVKTLCVSLSQLTAAVLFSCAGPANGPAGGVDSRSRCLGGCFCAGEQPPLPPPGWVSLWSWGRPEQELPSGWSLVHSARAPSLHRENKAGKHQLWWYLIELSKYQKAKDLQKIQDGVSTPSAYNLHHMQIICHADWSMTSSGDL